jgi:hypothetical protein
MKSAHGVYQILPDDDTTFAFVESIHNKGSAILQASGEPRAPKSMCLLWKEHAAT